MKKSFPLFLITIGLLIFSSCIKENAATFEPTDQPYLQTLVDQHNQKLASDSPEIEQAFLANGSIQFGMLDDDSLISFNFREVDSNGNLNKITIFNLGLEGDFNLSQKIDNAQVLFLRNQLLVTDLDNHNQFNFMVVGSKNAIAPNPDLQTIEGTYLTIQADPDLEIQGLVNCYCGCFPCPQCYGKSRCSCEDECPGVCSAYCSTGYQAACLSSCNNE